MTGTNPNEHPRRTVVVGLLGLLGGLFGVTLDVYSREQGAHMAEMLHTTKARFGEPFQTWVSIGPGRILAEARAVFARTNCIVIEVLEVRAYSKSPIPCQASLEVRVAEILEEFKRQELELQIDWSSTKWGEYRWLRHYVV